MEKKKLSLDQISRVPYYGRNFPFLPWTFISKLRVSFVFVRALSHELGLLRSIAFWLALPFRLVPTYRKYVSGFKLIGRQFGLMSESEWILLVIVFQVLEKKEGKEKASRFARRAIQETSKFLMNELYQADYLAEFEDPFEAFWAYHKAMFQNDPNYPNEFIEEKDLRVMVVHACRNCEIAQLTIPELSQLGCDHDITGYKTIEEKTNMVFRRPETLAKDGKPCRFMFYRKGTEPQGAYENH